MDWNRCLATRAGKMKASAVRQLLKLTARPDMISFAGGLPAAELFSLDRVAAAVQAVLAHVGPRALQYGETEGVAELRAWIARRYSTPRMRLDAGNVLITTGSQQVLDIAGRLWLDSGDSVIVENPTYLAALQAWRPCDAAFLPLGMDADGMSLEDLSQQLQHRPKLAYFMPNFQNPTGITMTLERRQGLIGRIQNHNVVVIEDSPYEELRYEGEPLPSLLELDLHPDAGGHVIRAGTFSKTLMPGLRVGWALGPQAVIGQMVKAKQAMDLHTSTFNQYVALELLNGGYEQECLPALRRAYRERRDAMLDALRRHFPPEARWTRPQGGMFIFVTLPKGISTAALLPRAMERNVAFVPGGEFHVDGAGQNTLRLNFTKASVPEIAAGIKTLAEVL